MKRMKNIRKVGMIAVIAVVVGGAGVMSQKITDNYFEISKTLEIFTTLYRELNIYYVDETNPGELMKTGIDAMLESLDPYTNYIPEADIEDYRFMTTGQYGGIGSQNGRWKRLYFRALRGFSGTKERFSSRR